MKSKFLMLAITLCLVLSFVGMVSAAVLTDVSDHWAQTQINKWVSDGYVSGYPDGSFQPNKEISRVEFITLVNRAYKKQDKNARCDFSDVKPSDWFYQAVASGKAAGFISGYPDGTFKPDNPISREEAAAIIVKLLSLTADSQDAITVFKDSDTFSVWSKPIINAVVINKMMSGYPDNTFKAKKFITRAEAVVTLDRAPVKPIPQLVAFEGIKGTVVTNGQPVEGATVKLFAKDGYEILKEATTDKDGKYEFTTASGIYDLTAVKEGYLGHASDVSAMKDSNAGQAITLVQGVNVSGKLLDNSGKAFANVKVVFTTNPTFLTKTDTSGTFGITVLPAHKYSVRSYVPNKESEGIKNIATNIEVGDTNLELGSLRANFSIGSTGGGGGGGGGTVTPEEPNPNAPVLSMAEQAGAVVLTWTAVDGANSYKVKRGDSPGQLVELISNIADITYTDNTVDSNTTYYYAVSSVRNGKESVNSNIVVRNAPPKAPALYGVRNDNSIMLNWTKPSGAERYTVYRSTNSGGPYYAIVENILLNQYTDSSIQSSSTYYYVVKAFNSVGESPYSTELTMTGTVTPEEPNPDAPVLSMSEQGGAVALTWTAVDGVSYYKVKRGDSPGQLVELISNIADINYTDNTVDSNTTYYYAVSSVRNGKESVNSNIVVRNAPPKAPALYGVRNDNSIILNWTKPSGAERYTAYRSTNSGGPYYAIVENILLNQYTDTNIQSDSTYYYVVKAFNSVGESPYSTELTMAPGSQQIDTFKPALDNDGDGLTNEQELLYGTDPNLQDTDKDSLTDDYEINISHTDPLNPDTDEDGIYDGAEMALGTDPLVKTNNNINTSKKAQTSDDTVQVVVYGDGNLTLAPLQVTKSDNVLLNSLEGIVDKAVDITAGGFNIASADISIKYDRNALGEVSEDDLTVFWVNTDTKQLVPLDNVQVDKNNGVVTGTTNHFSTYLLGDKNMPVDLSKVDIVFTIDQSGSMSSNDPHYYRIKATQKFISNMAKKPSSNELINRAGIVSFTDYATIRQSLTNNEQSLQQVLNSMMTCGGGTNLLSALNVSGTLFNDNTRRKIVVFLTDGQDGNSYQSIMDAASKLSSDRVVVNTVALGSGAATQRLSDIAQKTNGGYFFINNDPNLSQEDIDSQIQLIYDKLSKQITLTKKAEEDLTPEKISSIQFAAMYNGVDFELARRWMTSSNANLLTGNFVQQDEDINIDSTGQDLILERSYNSAAAGEKTVIGNGWRLNYDTNVKEVKNSGRVTSSTLNVRENPWGKIIAKISMDTEVSYQQENGQRKTERDLNGDIWYYVVLPDGKPGCVASWYIKDINGVEITYGSGSKITFELDKVELNKAVYKAPYEVYDRLEKGTDYVLTQKDQTKYIYSSSGKLDAIEDRYGNQLKISYNNSGKMDKVTDQVGRTLTFSYSGDKLVRVTDPIGCHVDYEYDANDNLTKVTDLNGKQATYNYYDKTDKANPNKLKQIIDANGHQVIKNDYDPFGRLVRQYDGNSYVKYQIYNDKYENEADNTLERYAINENGYESRITFNTDQKPIEERDALGGVIKHQYFVYYDEDKQWKDVTKLGEVGENGALYKTYYEKIKQQNRRTREIDTDKNGHPTTNEYDESKNLKSTTDPHNNTAAMSYDSQNNLTSVTDKRQKTTSYVYDSKGINLLKETDPLLKTVEYTYYTSLEVKGLLKYKKDKNGKDTTYEYDDVYNNLTAVIDPLTNKTTYEYDNVGRKTKEINARNYPTNYQYDNVGRLLSETDALGKAITSEYDAVGNLIATVDKNGSRTEYQYDAENQLIKVNDPLAGSKKYEYDPVGNKVKEINELGRETKYIYDALNRLVKVVDAKGSTTTYNYDGNGNKTKETDALCQETKYAYDYLNRLKELEDALGKKESYVYDANGNKTSYSDKNNNLTTYQYDELNQLKTQTEQNTAVTTFEYDNNGNRIKVIDALNGETTTDYDELNRPVSVKDALNNETTYQYDAVGNKKLEKDARLYPTTYEYDELNGLVKVTDAINNFSTMEYDAVGNNTAKVDKRGKRTEYTYDKLNRLVQIKDPYNNLTKYEYDATGNKTAVTDPKGNIITYEYDELKRLTKELDKNNNSKSYGYNAVGNKISETSPKGDTTQYEYDKINRLIAVIDPETTKTSYKYDGVGNLLEMTNGRGKTTSYEYNNINKPEKLKDQAGREETYQYDLIGNLTTKTDRNGVTTSYIYDALNRLKQESAGGITISYDYDEVGNRDEMNDVTGKTSYAYDEFNRLKEKTLPDGSKISYAYDAEGNRVSITDPVGNLTEYTYDDMNRMKTVKATGEETVYEYDENGNRKSLLYPNGTKTEYQYDYRNLLSELSITIPNTDPDTAAANALQIEKLSVSDMVYGGSSEPVMPNLASAQATALNDSTDNTSVAANTDNVTSYLPTLTYEGNSSVTKSVYGDQNSVTEQVYENSPKYDTPSLSSDKVTVTYTYEYGYDEDGNQIYKIEPKGRTDFTYDTLSRIKTVSGPDSKVITYSYDKAGNRATETVNGAGENKQVSYSYDNCNRLTSTTQTGDIFKTIEYTYDNNGNQTVVSEVYDGSTNISNFDYDVLNRLITVTKDGKSMSYTYNGDGLRTQKVVDGVTTTFYYIGKEVIFEKDSNGKNYRNVLGINLIARSDGSKLDYYLFNGHGDVVMMIAPDGARENIYDYDIFGNLISEKENGVKNPYRYAGYYYDGETGYYYLKARYYDPVIGRFVTQDSYRGKLNDPLSLNLYTYCQNEPVMHDDPDGHWSFLIGAGIGVGVQFASDLWNNYSERGNVFNWGNQNGWDIGKRYLGAAAGGAICGVGGGALIEAKLGTKAFISLSAGVGAAGNIADDAINGKITKDNLSRELGTSALVGALGGASAGGLYKAGEKYVSNKIVTKFVNSNRAAQRSVAREIGKKTGVSMNNVWHSLQKNAQEVLEKNSKIFATAESFIDKATQTYGSVVGEKWGDIQKGVNGLTNSVKNIFGSIKFGW